MMPSCLAALACLFCSPPALHPCLPLSVVQVVGFQRGSRRGGGSAATSAQGGGGSLTASTVASLEGEGSLPGAAGAAAASLALTATDLGKLPQAFTEGGLLLLLPQFVLHEPLFLVAALE